MKTKFFIILSLVFFAFTNVKSQTPVEISGQIKDAESKKALEFCTVSAFNKKDSLITGTVSDESGYFTLQLPKGTYKFKISFIGYKTDSVSTTFVGSDKFLGVFKLKPEVKILGEYSVKTNSQDNLIDREVHIVTDKMKAGTSSTKEVLDKMDGVEYDRYSKAIKVDNSDKVIILVDGVEKDQEYVKNLSPDRLKKIEVIRDPSGKYALEGYTAVINVILKNDYKGVEVLVSNENLFDVDAEKSKHIFLTNGSSATFNYTYNKFNFYTKYRNNLNNFTFTPINERHFVDSNLKINSYAANINGLENKYRESYNNLIYGADFNINPKNSFSFEGNYTFQPKSFNMNKSNDVLDFIKHDKLIKSEKNIFESNTESKSQYYSLFYNGKLNEKHSFKANITISNYSDEVTNIRRDSIGRIENEDITKNFKNKVKSYVEYYYTINDKHNIQFGYGNSYEELKNEYEIRKESFKGTNLTDFRNKIYSYYGFQPNKKFGIKVGIAAENTIPKLKIADKKVDKENYLIYLPYADVKYKLNNLFDFKLKYRASSNYPRIEQVSSAVSRVESNTVRIGNPLLKTDITHKLSFQINVMSGLAKVEPYFNYSDNLISQTFELKNDTAFFSYNNIDMYSEKGIMVNFTVPFGKYIFWQNDLNIYSPKLEYKNHTNKYTDFTLNSQLVYVNEPIDLVAGFKYQKGMRKHPMAQGYNKWNNDFWLLFVQKSFFNKSFSVMLAYITPIMYGIDTKQGSVFETTKYYDSRMININDVLNNIVIVELTYRFNKGKSVKKKEKDVEIINERSSKGFM